MHIEKIQQNNAPRVPELIMQALVKAIEDGHIRVGEDMPSERDLAEMLGVGRGSLRECLAILEFLGAIDSRGNRKVLLRDADYIQKARTWIECSNEMGGTEPFNEFRRVIEVGIVGLACERATEEDMAVLDEAIRNLDEDPANYMHDVEFHDALAVASHNAMLASTIHLVNNLIADVRMRFWDLAKAFNQGAGFGIGLLLLPFIFQMILGFGSAQYRDGAQANTQPDMVEDVVNKAKDAISHNNGQEQ